MALRNLSIDIDYTGRGESILRQFVIPALTESVEYDRVTSFFTTQSLVSISEGLNKLLLNHGRMRLVLGIHDVPPDLAQAVTISDDVTAELISSFRRRLIEGLTTIADELVVDRLLTLAWMIKDGVLSVRIAAPEILAPGNPGLFHNKVFIFRDADGNVVAGVGSSNETSAGLGQNFEHLTAFTSWNQKQYTDRQEEFFNKLWADKQPGLIVRELDSSFADEIISALQHSKSPDSKQYREPHETLAPILDTAARMPSLSMVAGRHTALFPHQELIFLEALSRWPVRALLADEVGLGKTFEAGSILSHLLQHNIVKSVVLLVPKAVVYQWQAELSEHFGLESWVYDSSRRVFLSSSGRIRALGCNDSIIGTKTPTVAIISSQLARGTRAGNHIFRDATHLPDLLVVDEAHAARVKPDISGSEHPTLVWKMLRDAVDVIPHVVLATATPMQVHWREYHALLELLGLPKDWQKPANYRRSLELLSASTGCDMADAGLAVRLIHSSLISYKPEKLALSSAEQELSTLILTFDLHNLTDIAINVRAKWSVAKSLLFKVHPARFLTLRNTRSALEKIGYKFPTRNLPPINLSIPARIQLFYKKVEEYLTTEYFQVERALFPNKKFSIGFVKCAYQQRLASSMEACLRSLKRRKDRVASIEYDLTNVALIETVFEELEESDSFDFESSPDFAKDGVLSDDVQRAARIERVFLEDLLKQLEDILQSHVDPKISETLRLIEKHTEEDDRVLIFSRYTDTLDAAIEAFRRSTSSSPIPFGVYTGKQAEIDYGKGPIISSRGEIRDALNNNKITIVFCSDAASEGLNLQTARVLINIDVPWNPARLEQRIGRIARLGQRAETVDVYNLWYPNSIEAKMYTRLLERRELYELAVGEFPEVVSAAIRDELSSELGGQQPKKDAIAELNNLKNSMQVNALLGLWDREVAEKTLTSRFREELAALVRASAIASGAAVSNRGAVVEILHGTVRAEFSTAAGTDNVISLTHPALAWLREAPFTACVEEGYQILTTKTNPAFFAVHGVASSPVTLPGLLRVMSDKLSNVQVTTPENLTANPNGRLLSTWCPNRTALSIPTKVTFSSVEPLVCDLRALAIEQIGRGTH